MKNGSFSSRTNPPAHLPVLTEVVQFSDQETEPGALFVLPDSPRSPHADTDLEDDLPSPQWLLKKSDETPSARHVPDKVGDRTEPSLQATLGPTAADHYIPDTAASFSSSWWMADRDAADMSTPADLQAAGVGLDAAKASKPLTAASTTFSAEALVQQVLSDLDRQVSTMFEHRMRQAIVPAFARATDALLEELRRELSAGLRDMVARAVSMQLARHVQTHSDDGAN